MVSVPGRSFNKRRSGIFPYFHMMPFFASKAAEPSEYVVNSSQRMANNAKIGKEDDELKNSLLST